MKYKKIFKKFNINKIPLLTGLLFVLKDIYIWCYAIYKFLFVFKTDSILADILGNIMFIHLPSSILAAIIQYSFFQEGNFVSFYLLIFIFGLIQCFIIGFFYGLIIFGIIKLGQRYQKQFSFIKHKLIAFWRKINIV